MAEFRHTLDLLAEPGHYVKVVIARPELAEKLAEARAAVAQEKEEQHHH